MRKPYFIKTCGDVIIVVVVIVIVQRSERREQPEESRCRQPDVVNSAGISALDRI